MKNEATRLFGGAPRCEYLCLDLSIGSSTVIFRQVGARSRRFVHRSSKALVASPAASPVGKLKLAVRIAPYWDHATESSVERSSGRIPEFQRREECANHIF